VAGAAVLVSAHPPLRSPASLCAFRGERKGGILRLMPIQASFGRKSTFRVFGVNGELLASEDLGSDEEAIAWARRLIKDGLSVGRLSRDITAGFGMDIPLH
jgi:hypothetical protein